MKKSWDNYYKKVSGRASDPILKIALSKFKMKNASAYDLGCGAGDDTLFLLKNGFKVFAVDKEESSLKFVQAKTELSLQKNLNLIHESFEKLAFQKCSFIYSRASLPFCHPKKFNKIWNNIEKSLLPEGLFCGTLFGDQDTWAKNTKMSFVKRSDFKNLLKHFEILYFDERIFEGTTVLGNKKRWHIYYLILKKI